MQHKRINPKITNGLDIISNKSFREFVNKNIGEGHINTLRLKYRIKREMDALLYQGISFADGIRKLAEKPFVIENKKISISESTVRNYYNQVK